MYKTMDNTKNSNIFNDGDLVLYKENGKIMSGGYSIDSILLQSGESPLTSYFNGGTLESEGLEGNKEREKERKNPFANLAIPVGIFYINQQATKSDYEKKSYDDEHYKKHDMLSDDIYDKLFEMASSNRRDKKDDKKDDKKKHKFTKHHNIKKIPNKQTKKQRIV